MDVYAVLIRHLDIAARRRPSPTLKACFLQALDRLFPSGVLTPGDRRQHGIAVVAYEEGTGPVNTTEVPIRVDREFQTLIPPLSPDERDTLEAGLVADGCREPLVLWKGHGILVDGHHRYELCEANSIRYGVVEREFADRKAVKLWMLENQLGRRNLTDDQRAAFAFQVAEQRGAIAKQERAAKGADSVTRDGESGQFHRLAATGAAKRSDDAKREPREREKAAKEAKVTEHKVRAVAAVAKADPAMVGRIASGERTIHEAKQAVKAKSVPRRPPPPTVPAPKALADLQASCDRLVDHLEAVLAEMRAAWGVRKLGNNEYELADPVARRIFSCATYFDVKKLLREQHDNFPLGQQPDGSIYLARHEADRLGTSSAEARRVFNQGEARKGAAA